jgi:hypothetical protein
MCVSSAVSDYYMHPNWPGRLNPNQSPIPAQWPQTFQQIIQSDPETKEMLRKVISLLDSIDKRLGDRDCLDDKKAEFYKALDLEPPTN